MSKIKKLLSIGLLGLSVFVDSSEECSSSNCESPISQNLWQPHAFSGYALQDILILQGLDCQKDQGDWVNRFGFVTEYMQNFGKDCQSLGAMPFWSGTNTMTIGNHDGKADLDAYQFGMGDVVTDADGIAGTITLNPQVQHVGTEFLWYIMQNEDKPGFYAKVKAPLGAMMVTSSICESPIELAEESEPSPYPQELLRFTSLGQALHGGYYNQDPLYSYGKLACNKRTVIRLGDIAAVVGANFVAKEHGHIGVGVKVSCPTGNVPQAQYMLEPIFGRAGHWGVGAELSAHYTHVSDKDSCASGAWTVWAQAELLHLFDGRQPSWRSFDLKANGPGSRYLLVQRYAYQDSTFGFQPQGIHPVINVTTLPVHSSFAMEGNFAVLLDYTRNQWNISLGGEFWGRSTEKLSIDCCRPLQDRDQGFLDYNLNDYAVLGRQLVPSGIASIYWCEPLARINESLPTYNNQGPVPAGIKDPTVSANRIPADYNEALDICGAAAKRIFTGKVLGEIGYTWSDNGHVPHLSVFAGAELADKKSHWVNLWSVGLQASLQF